MREISLMSSCLIGGALPKMGGALVKPISDINLVQRHFISALYFDTKGMPRQPWYAVSVFSLVQVRKISTSVEVVDVPIRYVY